VFSVEGASSSSDALLTRNHDGAADLYSDLDVQVIRRTWELWSARCGLAEQGR